MYKEHSGNQMFLTRASGCMKLCILNMYSSNAEKIDGLGKSPTQNGLT